MWPTKYASAVPKNLGVGVNFRPISEGYFLFGRPQSVVTRHSERFFHASSLLFETMSNNRAGPIKNVKDSLSIYLE